MKIIFYGNTLMDNIEYTSTAEHEKQRIINTFLPLGMDIFRTTQRLVMPRAIIRDFPDTLDKSSELYLQLCKLKAYFGNCLTQVNYIPVSGDLEMIINDEQFFLSSILLAISADIGQITIEP